MKRFARWLLFITIVATSSHILAVLFLPKALMAVVMFSTRAEVGGPNRLYIPDRITAKVRKVVRPAPDLAYAVCAFDLSEGPVLATLNASESYASLSVFSNNTDNIFAINDRAISGELIKVVLVKGNMTITPSEDVITVQAPGNTGLILWRRVITSNADWPRMDAARREVSCAPYY